MKSTLKTFVFGSLFAIASSVFAQATDSPVGLWKTIDDETKQTKSLVRISESGGAFVGALSPHLGAGRSRWCGSFPPLQR